MKRFTYRITAGNSDTGPCGFCFDYVVEAETEPSDDSILKAAADEISYHEIHEDLSDDEDGAIQEFSFYVGDIEPKDLTIEDMTVEDA